MKKKMKFDSRKSAADEDRTLKFKRELEGQQKTISDLQMQLIDKDRKILVSSTLLRLVASHSTPLHPIVS